MNWVTEAQAVAEKLAYVNDAGNAIVKVDNTTYIPKGQKRDTVSGRGAFLLAACDYTWA